MVVERLEKPIQMRCSSHDDQDMENLMRAPPDIEGTR